MRVCGVDTYVRCVWGVAGGGTITHTLSCVMLYHMSPSRSMARWVKGTRRLNFNPKLPDKSPCGWAGEVFCPRTITTVLL